MSALLCVLQLRTGYGKFHKSIKFIIAIWAIHIKRYTYITLKLKRKPSLDYVAFLGYQFFKGL